ncbi:hypothetical protein CPAR01_13143 [Colletotrichum paranaense]|uniref:Integral membrane protein n=2 Tax=Colletotrichum acutatum species complex TaxID=2707335 RepID=A0ABQ9Q2N2_9PEZI|nr:uncharacterized protein CPAR01_13143 [Colletotrichum paranaense]KAK0378048.1 hypothetical protein CLIM01_04594 [Colletotrichum limetticola]KAK1526615.1 hypothetical protein CPAR01_13143 [Colletotrichum paranaense]
MCLILQPTSQCKVCLQLIRLEDVNQFCANTVNIPSGTNWANISPSILGSCGTLKLTRVQRLAQFVCEHCRWSAEQSAKDFYEFLYPSPHKYFGESAHGFAKEFLSRSSAPSPGKQRPFPRNNKGKSYSLPLLARTAISRFPIPAGSGSTQSEASSEASVATTHLNHLSTLDPPARSKYEFHSSSSVYSCTSESSDEDSLEDNQNDSRCLRWANSVDLMNSKQQPPPLNMLIDQTQNLPDTPKSAKQLRVVSSWGARAAHNPEEDPWWLPETWGAIQDLTSDLVEYLSKAELISTFHGHSVHVSRNENETSAWDESLTVIIATPGGTRARIMTGEVYQQGVSLAGLRMIDRARYQHISKKEQKHMEKAGLGCIFYPCRVASCPLSHKKDQHQPWPSNGESLLAGLERGYRMRKNWKSRASISASMAPTPTPRQYSSPFPVRGRSPVVDGGLSRRRPAPLDLTKTKEVRFTDAADVTESTWSRGDVTPHPSSLQTAISDEEEEGPLTTPDWFEPLMNTPLKVKGDMMVKYGGRAGRVRPQKYDLNPASERNESPLLHVRSETSPQQIPQTWGASIFGQVYNARRAAADSSCDDTSKLRALPML